MIHDTSRAVRRDGVEPVSSKDRHKRSKVEHYAVTIFDKKPKVYSSTVSRTRGDFIGVL
jgi:hypothetical protein